MRTGKVERNTLETKIALSIDLDGKGISDIDTGCGFLDHMLTLLSSHSRFDLSVHCKGDTNVDDHHTVEDIGIALGVAFKEALGSKAGIRRYGWMILAMDESLVLSALDISGRSELNMDVEIPTQKVGEFDTELVKEFWLGFVRKAEITLHIKKLYGANSHHIIEAMFKSVARSLKEAVSLDPTLNDEIPSSKGVL